MSTKNWEERFDEEFFSPFWSPRRKGKAKDFLREALKKQRGEVWEKIRAMRKPLWSDDAYQHNRNIERENVLNELEASLQEPIT